MMHIGLIDLGFTPGGVDFLTGNAESIEIDLVSLEDFQLMSSTEQANVILMQCLSPEKEEAAAYPTKNNATAETEPSEKETITMNSTANLDSETMTRAQVQMLASLVHSLDPSQDPGYLFQEIDAWRGTKTMDKLVSDLVNVLGNAVAEIQSEGAEPSTQPAKDTRYNARTNKRMTFYPVDSVASSHREASLPKGSQVQAIQNMHGAVTLFAWIDNADGPADYVHHHARLSEFRMED